MRSVLIRVGMDGHGSNAGFHSLVAVSITWDAAASSVPGITELSVSLTFSWFAL